MYVSKKFLEQTVEAFGIKFDIYANIHFMEQAARRYDTVYSTESEASAQADAMDMVIHDVSKIKELVEETTLPYAAEPDAKEGDLFCVFNAVSNTLFYLEIRKGSIEATTIVRLSPRSNAYVSRNVLCAYVIEKTEISPHCPYDNGEFDPSHPRLKVSEDSHGVDERREKKYK